MSRRKREAAGRLVAVVLVLALAGGVLISTMMRDPGEPIDPSDGLGGGPVASDPPGTGGGSETPGTDEPAPTPGDEADGLAIAWWEPTSADHTEFRLVTSRRPHTEIGAEAMLRAALTALFEGPNDEERAAGMISQIPADVRVLDVEVRRPIATIDVSAEFGQMGGSMRVQGALDQVAATATAITGIKGVVLKVDGKQVGTRENPFAGEGFLFDVLLPPANGHVLPAHGPEDVMDTFIAAIPDVQVMWALASQALHAQWGAPENIDWTAYAEGLGAYRDYTVTSTVDGDRATVTLSGEQELEGMREHVTYEATLVREDGVWKFDSGRRL